MAAGILRVTAPDKKGIIFAVTGFLSDAGGNILELEQFVDREVDMFFMRVVWDLSDFTVPIEKFDEAFEKIASRLSITYSFNTDDERDRLALFVSKEPSCLAEVLLQWRLGAIPVDIPLVIGNHKNASDIAENFSIPFSYIPIEKDNQVEAESRQLKLLEEYQIDFIGLARYMRILTGNFVLHYRDRILNIHHSFLPAFAGADPYRQAYQRGVKIIGATSHFVTDRLDEGPIIAQSVEQVDHIFSVSELKKVGQDIERKVFFNALKKYAERKIIRYGDRTVVFR